MDFAVDLNRDDHAAATALLLGVTSWNQPPGRKYLTGEVTDEARRYFKGCARAFFIKMEPGTHVYRHRDPREVVDNFDTDHIVVSTNDQSFICWEDPRTKEACQVHLKLGHRYRILDRGVLHWAVNNGDTDRVHLLIEYPISSRRRA